MLNDFSPVNLPWYWRPRVTPKEPSSGFDRVGVGLFLKDISRLAIPMSLVAAAFGIYMNAKIVELKEIVREAVAAHESQERANFVTRIEWDAYQRLDSERIQTLQRSNEKQTDQIRKNTILLERIALKIGAKREVGD
jgi:hypothetical protein